jgi:hypothetical protein
MACSSSVGTTRTAVDASSREITVSARSVAVVVEGDAEHVEARAHARTDHGAVLADAGGEHERVASAEHGDVGADVLLDPVAEHVEGELGRVVAGVARAVISRMSESPHSPSRPLTRLRSPSTSAGCARTHGDVGR